MPTENAIANAPSCLAFAIMRDRLKMSQGCQIVETSVGVEAKRRPSFGPIASKSLGGSGMAILPNGHCAVADAERGVPGDPDGILHALMRGTALDVDGQRTLRRLHSVSGHREVVVHVDRPDPD